MVRIFIGVAWPYANGPFHLGHLVGAYLPGDTFARFHRLRGDEVLMVSGSDMHGTPILVTAEQEGRSAEEVARQYDAVNREAFQKLGFSFDLFTHTHTVVHERTVQEVFLRLLQNGFIDRRSEELPFCPKHARFLPDRYVTGECPHCRFPTARGDECDNCGRVVEPRQLGSPKCVLCGTPAEFRTSEHFFLRLDKLQPALERYIAEKQDWRSNVLGGARRFLEAGLRPTAITRDLEWGVPIPLDGYDRKRFYVWFDALIGYLSASREWAIRSGRPEAWKRYWDPNERVHQYYFIGKDNIFHHSIVWPGILLGHGDLLLPHDVPANEWLRISGGKISKSRSRETDVFIPSLLAQYPPDVIRFYAAQLAPQHHDTEFDWKEFDQLSREVLSNQYGNLVQRLLVLTRERCEGKIPSPPPGWSRDVSGGVGLRIASTHARIASEYEAVHLKEALETALAEVREANRTFHEAKPWSAPDVDRLRTLYETLWMVKAIAIWLSPVLPHSSDQVFRMLGFPHGPEAGEWDQALEPVPPGQPLGEVRPLFPKAEETVRAAEETKAAPPGVALDLPSLDVRAAVVRHVSNHPSADRLYVLELDLGEEKPRTVVAGIRPFYAPEELRGTTVALLANLEPRVIRKMTSNGMILAADDGEAAVLLEPPEGVVPGQRIDGEKEGAPSLTYEEFNRTPLLTGVSRGPDEAGVSRVDVGGSDLLVPGEFPAGTAVVVRRSTPSSTDGTVLAFGPGKLLRLRKALPAGRRVR